jgi:hypothetical protein
MTLYSVKDDSDTINNRLFCPKFSEPCASNKVVKVLQGEDFTARRQQQLFHVFAADLEAAPGNADDHFKLWSSSSVRPSGQSIGKVYEIDRAWLLHFRRCVYQIGTH